MARMTSARSETASAPCSKIALRARRCVSVADSPPRFSTRSSSARASIFSPRRGLARDHSRATSSTMRRRSSRSGRARVKRAREGLELGRDLALVADEHDGARAVLVVLGDVLQEAHIGRLAQVGVKVEQHVHAGERRGAQVLEDVHRLGERTVGRPDLDIQTLEAVGHAPLEERHATVRQRHGRWQRGRRLAEARAGAGAGSAQRVQRLRLIARLDDDERYPRSQQGLEVVGWHARRD